MPSYRGIVKGNVIVLEENVRLPDGLPVTVEVEKEPDYSKDPFLVVDEWSPVSSGEVPKDLAHQHDHYLYWSKQALNEPIFIDTAGWLALINRHDQLHNQVVKVYRSLERVPRLTTDAVIIETHKSRPCL